LQVALEVLVARLGAVQGRVGHADVTDAPPRAPTVHVPDDVTVSVPGPTDARRDETFETETKTEAEFSKPRSRPGQKRCPSDRQRPTLFHADLSRDHNG